MAKKKKKKPTKPSSKSSTKRSSSKKGKKKSPIRKKVSAKGRAQARLASVNDNWMSIDDLYCAYRKAKADLFFDRSQATAIAFCEYEDNLAKNLKRLKKRLESSINPWWEDCDFIGTTTVIPKRLSYDATRGNDYVSEDPEPIGISDPEEAWRFKTSNYAVQPTFRPIADFTVDMHVVSALWINLVGEKYDSLLGKEALGTRVRRLREQDLEEDGGTYHSDVWQTFKPYFEAYKKWRNDGFRAIEAGLKGGKKLVLIMLDFESFFHRIDAEFLLDRKYLVKAKYRQVHGEMPPVHEKQFTERLVSAFSTWGNNNPIRNEADPIGLPVGSTASRIIANCLLAEFDRHVQKQLSPVYYSRYVDDIFLVIEDHGGFDSKEDITEYLCRELEAYAKPDKRFANVEIELPYAPKSKLKFQAKKQRYFKLSGRSGLELLDTIRSSIDEMTSEWRLLPDLHEMEESASIKVLTNSTDQLEANALRKTDGLSVRRLGLALILRKMRALAAMLPNAEWSSTRYELFDLISRHVITPLRIFDLYTYLPQLVGLAVATSNWKTASHLIASIKTAFDEIMEKDDLPDHSRTVPKESTWNCLFENLQGLLHQSVLQNVPLDLLDEEAAASLNSLVGQIANLSSTELSRSGVCVLAEKLYCRDLASYPYKEQLFGGLGRQMLSDDFVADQANEDRFCRISDVLSSQTLSERGAKILKFIESAGRADHELTAMLFPTRPLSVEEVTICDPKTSDDIEQLKEYVNAIRGTWYKKEKTAAIATASERIQIGLGKRNRKPRIALTNFKTADSCWSKAAANKPNLTGNRFQQIASICLSIAKESRASRIDYVIFPELSIPRAWLYPIARFFINYKISMIAGVEYGHPKKGEVTNQAYMFLTDDRIGYPSWTVIYQQKQKPALHEEQELWNGFHTALCQDECEFWKKRIYSHFGFEFGLLVCSELTNIEFRQHFRGKIDSLIVLSWNRDLDSFAALVDSAAMDIHCFLVLVNNRKYGDSRVRVPYSKHWQRDPVRVKGGLADYFVIAEIDYGPLRDFQSHKVSPKGPFKPKPEGFEISDPREVVPGGK